MRHFEGGLRHTAPEYARDDGARLQSDSHGGQALCVHEHQRTVFGVPVINVLWTIVAGRRFDREDWRVQRMMNLLNR